MTQDTEKERAECRKAFEFELIDNHQYVPSDFGRDGDYYADDDTQFAWELAWSSWQAARRAPAAPVPQGCKPVPVELLERIQESLGSFVSDQGWSQSDMDTADALDGLLAAAPQPPEAAPVQLPEYGIDTANHAGIRVRGYTEQQVRELLANHGIQEQNT